MIPSSPRQAIQWCSTEEEALKFAEECGRLGDGAAVAKVTHRVTIEKVAHLVEVVE